MRKYKTSKYVLYAMLVLNGLSQVMSRNFAKGLQQSLKETVRTLTGVGDISILGYMASGQCESGEDPNTDKDPVSQSSGTLDSIMGGWFVFKMHLYRPNCT